MDKDRCNATALNSAFTGCAHASCRFTVFSNHLLRISFALATALLFGLAPTVLYADVIAVVGAGGETISVSTSTTGNATVSSNPNTATVTGSTGSSGIIVTTPSAGTLVGGVTIANSPGFSILSTNSGGGTPPTNSGIYGAVDVSRASDLTDFLYQCDREFIAFARPDPAVSGTGSLSAAQAVDNRAMSAA